MTTEPFTHHTFHPIRTDGDRRIVAEEARWRAISLANKSAERKQVKCRVGIGGDLFEPWEGPIVDEDGKRLCIYLPNGGILKTEIYAGSPGPHCRWLSVADVRRRVFALIGDCPHIDFLINTTRPTDAVRVVNECIRSSVTEEDGDKIYNAFRSRIWMGATVSTQAEVNERFPLLLRLPAAVRWVRCVPGERMDLLRWFGPQNEGQWMNVVECGHRNQDYGINWLTIAGSLTEPTNLDHVRGIIAQGRAAGVPVWVERMGVRQIESMPGNRGVVEYVLRDPHGADPAEWPDDLRVREVPR